MYVLIFLYMNIYTHVLIKIVYRIFVKDLSYFIFFVKDLSYFISLYMNIVSDICII